MKSKFLVAMGLTVVLAAQGAFAGTATFSGSEGDVELSLPASATQNTCSYVINAGATVQLSTAVGESPLFSDGGQVITAEVVGNNVAGGTFSLVLNLIGISGGGFPFINGDLRANLTSTGLSITRDGAVLVSAAVDEVSTIQVETTATTIVLRYHDGTNFVDVGTGPLNLATIGGTEDLSADRMQVAIAATGTSFLLNEIEWVGTVNDTNQAGTPCDVTPIPDVVGLDVAAAITALTDAGYTAVTQYDGNFESPSFGQVLSQDPVAGTLGGGGEVTLIVAGVEIANDTDADGLDDDWEIANFGNIAAQGRWGDPDGDSSWNVREFYNETDPNNPESRVPAADFLGLIALALMLGGVGVVMAVRKVRA